MITLGVPCALPCLRLGHVRAHSANLANTKIKRSFNGVIAGHRVGGRAASVRVRALNAVPGDDDEDEDSEDDLLDEALDDEDIDVEAALAPASSASSQDDFNLDDLIASRDSEGAPLG